MKKQSDHTFLLGILLFIFLLNLFPDLGYGQKGDEQNATNSEGLISIWVKPEWSLKHANRVEIWATKEVNGNRLVLEKSELGILRAVLYTPAGTTVARTGIKDWKPGEWHFVSVGWKLNNSVSDNNPSVTLAAESGILVLWVDKVAKDGPVVPFRFSISTVDISCRRRPGILDPVLNITGDNKYGMVSLVYHDYFRTAPYDAIKVNVESANVPSDARAVAGFEKQFGLNARLNRKWEPVTENVVRYSQWAYFDAKPFIRWSTSDPVIAKIDSTGRLTALKPGNCYVIAKFQGKTSRCLVSVIDSKKPDAGAICISLGPRFQTDAVKNRAVPGDTITAKLRFGNFGTAPLPAATRVRFMLIAESNKNFKIDPEDKPLKVALLKTDKVLQPGEESMITIKFILPAVPAWMILELDPDNRVDEFCEVNNTIAELSTARPIQIGFRRKDVESCVIEKKINHLGSMSFYDWLRGEKLRMDVILREAVWPTTGPNGVEEFYRIDTYTELVGGNAEVEPWQQEAKWYDGGFPVNETVDLMSVDCAIIHEFGHTILSQPDLYGYPVKVSNVFVTSDEGQLVAGSPLLPVVKGKDVLPASGGINVAGYVGYPSLMDGCQLWLHPSQAGHIQYYMGYRADRFWGTQGRLIPERANWLILTDINDYPLKGAAVYVYQVSQAPVEDSGEKFFSDRPKFIGLTDDFGRFVFPNITDSLWDDPETDEVDGAVGIWNPFGTKVRETAFTPNVWTVEGLLLIKVVSGNQSEYHFMDLTQFNTEFLSGHKALGTYALNTSLRSTGKQTTIKRTSIPAAIQTVNKRPTAVAPPVINVKTNEEFVIDGSQSHDPEGQTLIYRWNLAQGWLHGNLSQSPTLKLKAPDKPGKLEYKFWVLDGIRCSLPVYIKVNVTD
jgi:hypothetical protein